MKIIPLKNDISFDTVTKSVVTVGNFDGLHKGHQYILDTLTTEAKKHDAVSILVTFEPHTRAFLNPDTAPPRLTTFDEKAYILKNSNIDYLVCLDFNTQLSSLSPEQFTQDILISQLKASVWVMGNNHFFGKNRQGNNNFLNSARGINHFTIVSVDLHSDTVSEISSTEIRSLIENNEIDKAVLKLGHPYVIIAERIRGVQKGTELGYPTLNFRCPPSQKFVPQPGIYAASIEFDQYSLQGALYFGNCPTYTGRDFHFEFNSLDRIVKDPALHSDVVILLHKYIRGDISFESEDMLVKQITEDVKQIKSYFTKE